MFGALGGAVHDTCLTFVSKAAAAASIPEKYGVRKRTHAVGNIRGITKRNMVHNNLMPNIEVDSQTYEVRADGKLLTCEPAKILPLAQKYFLF